MLAPTRRKLTLASLAITSSMRQELLMRWTDSWKDPFLWYDETQEGSESGRNTLSISYATGCGSYGSGSGSEGSGSDSEEKEGSDAGIDSGWEDGSGSDSIDDTEAELFCVEQTCGPACKPCATMDSMYRIASQSEPQRYPLTSLTLVPFLLHDGQE